MTMKILLTGAAGQLGRELKRSLAPLGDVLALDRSQLDLVDPDALRTTLREIKPNLIVNAAAYTAVDKAETEYALADAINARAPGLLAEEAQRLDARLIHYSTDYVFDGRGSQRWQEDSPTGPLGVYGASKLAGERAILASDARALILRTSWVFGLHGANFMRTMLRLAKDRAELGVINAQFGAPTWTRHLADATALLAAKPDATGLYHLTNGGETTWAGYAEAIFTEAQRLGLLRQRPQVKRIATADYPLPAKRPQNSRLDCSRLASEHGIALPDWRVALNDCLADAIH